MPKIGFIFSGQGSQYVGMGKELYDNFIESKEIFNKANKVLGFDMIETCFNGEKEALNVTEITQPAVLTVSIAAMKALEAAGFKADATAGFSLGEYSALICSGALSFEEGVALVRKRGRFMQEAVPVGIGGMAAVLGLSRELVLEGCGEASKFGIVEAVNFNCPGQIVIAGENEALNMAVNFLTNKGGKCIKLSVSAPFHSSMLKGAAEKLGLELKDISFGQINTPILSNVHGNYISKEEDIKELLVKQAMSPVLWENIINKMIEDGIEVFVELGPGKTLTGFLKKIDRKITVLNIEDLKSFNNTIEVLKKLQ